ncbi:GNAT family N-acetyltransferase [Alkalihalophilus marmarensis]|uniref:GNAT family N-acetyltransferase n=1 Tax=Alkalihalophilus marmarensis TaxID=521377 RepID=UPI0020412586|nr:GNAT family N-acetyltransferase [Alkalihalophilus marmarensis]
MQTFQLSGFTERLIVRPYQYHDYMNWFNQYSSRKPSVHLYDEGQVDMSMCTEQWFYDLVNRHQGMAIEDSLYVFGVFNKSDHTHLGVIDVSTLMRENFHWGRIGYTIHNQHWGKGYGTESVKEVLRLAHTELNYHRIEAHINIDNSASIALAKKAGMQYECIRKGFIHEFRKWTDYLIYYSQSNE